MLSPLAASGSPALVHALLQWLLALTAVSSAALLLVLALRPLLRRLGGPAPAYAAWALVPLALLAALLPQPELQQGAAPLFSLRLAPAEQAGPLLGNADDATWLALWLAGAALLLAAMVWQQRRFQRGLGTLAPAGARRVLRATHAQAGPLVLGLLRPRIVLPADFQQRYSAPERTLILAHEAAHLRHGDLAANALACALQALFWFNPLVHLAAARLRLDQELACDDAVLRRHPQQRQAYAHAMLKTQLAAGDAGRRPLANALLPVLLPMACHWTPHHPLKERIMQLARPTPRRAQRRAMHTLLLVAALLTGYSAWAAVADLDAVPLLRGKAHAMPAQQHQPAAAGATHVSAPARDNGKDCRLPRQIEVEPLSIIA